MKKILFSSLILICLFCLTGCNIFYKKVPLTTLVKNENFTDAYIVSIGDNETLIDYDYNELKEKEFYKNIMNSIAMEEEVLPSVTPSWSLIIESDDHNLQIDDLGYLYAKYKGKWYYIKCADTDLQALTDYLLGEE